MRTCMQIYWHASSPVVADLRLVLAVRLGCVARRGPVGLVLEQFLRRVSEEALQKRRQQRSRKRQNEHQQSASCPMFSSTSPSTCHHPHPCVPSAAAHAHLGPVWAFAAVQTQLALELLHRPLHIQLARRPRYKGNAHGVHGGGVRVAAALARRPSERRLRDEEIPGRKGTVASKTNRISPRAS